MDTFDIKQISPVENRSFPVISHNLYVLSQGLYRILLLKLSMFCVVSQNNQLFCGIY